MVKTGSRIMKGKLVVVKGGRGMVKGWKEERKEDAKGGRGMMKGRREVVKGGRGTKEMVRSGRGMVNW